MTLDQIKPFFPLIGPLVALVISVVVLPLLRQWLLLYKAEHQMVKRQFFEYTEVILFGVFQGRVEYDALGVLRTILFGERLFELIVGWNKRPSPNLITPDNAHAAERVRTVMRMHANSLLLQCARIGPYFDVGQKHGSAEYRFVKFVACLVRPDAAKLTWHDCPRIVLIEEGALRKIHEGPVEPNTPDKDGGLWVTILQEIATEYFEGRHQAIEVITSPAGN